MMNYDLSWFQDEDVFAIIDALNVAVEDLQDRVENLADTGDYSEDDIADMARHAEEFNALFARISGSTRWTP